MCCFFFFQAEDGIRDDLVTGVQTCALPIFADAQNKSAGMQYRQHLDSPEFQMVRAKLRSEAGEARDAVAHFEGSLRDKRYASEAGARYGLTSALLRARRPRDAEAALARVRATDAGGPMIETLAPRGKHALADNAPPPAPPTPPPPPSPHSPPPLYP